MNKKKKALIRAINTIRRNCEDRLTAGNGHCAFCEFSSILGEDECLLLSSEPAKWEIKERTYTRLVVDKEISKLVFNKTQNKMANG